ncbi:ATP-dependent metallopeptidase FtsH/Yme1/Tma family protein, partial [Paenibacillus odorifer]
MNRFIRNSGFYLILFLVVVGIVQFVSNGNEAADFPRYDELRQEIKNNNVKDLTVQFEGNAFLVTGEYRELPADTKSKSFSTYIPPTDAAINELIQASDVNGIELTQKKMEGTSIWLTFLSSIIPLVIMFILFFFLFNQAQGGGGKVMNFGKSKARLYNEEKKKISFEDVAGADEEKQELVEVVEFLKDPRKFAAVGARIPKGV